MILESRSGPVDLSTDTMSALQIRFPSRDVPSELLKAHLWLLRYPARRPASIWRFIDNWLKKAPAVIRPATVVHAWWATDERTINQGAAVGISARPGESMSDFRNRVSLKLKAS